MQKVQRQEPALEEARNSKVADFFSFILFSSAKQQVSADSNKLLRVKSTFLDELQVDDNYRAFMSVSMLKMVFAQPFLINGIA
jgi:hypothetical protein